MRVRKTVDTWQIHVDYGYGEGYEHEVTEHTRKEGLARLREYRENAPQYPVKMVFKREKKA